VGCKIASQVRWNIIDAVANVLNIQDCSVAESAKVHVKGVQMFACNVKVEPGHAFILVSCSHHKIQRQLRSPRFKPLSRQTLLHLGQNPPLD
jgi:hypothetical protein